MSLNFKRALVGLSVLVAIVLYPLASVGKSTDKGGLEFNEDNLVTIRGEVSEESVAQAINTLRSLDAQTSRFGKNKPIYLFLDTPGGDIQAGLELIEAAEGLKRPVHTVTLFAASMGFQIAQNMGNRYILKNGVLMSHRAAGGFQGSFGGKNPSQLDSRYSFWLKRIEELDQQTVKRTNGKQTLESYRKQYADEMWLTGTQSVEQGYADQVVSVRCSDTLSGSDGHDVNFMGFRVHYETSKCPIITSLQNIAIGSLDGKNIFTAPTPAVVEEVKQKFIDQFTHEKTLR